ncbi:MAG: hypothetical protein QM705_07540 [Ancrocorticia sp.]
MRSDQPDAPKNRPARPRSVKAQSGREVPAPRSGAGDRADGEQRQAAAARAAAGRANAASGRANAAGRATGPRPQNAAPRSPQSTQSPKAPRSPREPQSSQQPRRTRGSAVPASDNKSQSARMRAQERQRRLAAEQSAQRRRRIIVLTLIIAAVVLTASLAVYLLGNRSDEMSYQQEHPTERWSPVACSPETLKTTMEAPLTAAAGSPINFTVKLDNLSDKHPCFIEVGWSNVDISITSGTDTILSTQQCAIGAENKRLLLDRSMSTSFVVTWPGGVGDEACVTPTESASQPGSYQAKLSFGDSASDSAQVAFLLQ